MPRPGPRPYECVRRAWHSERHQPMRGTLIQELFRIVGDAHSVDTRSNREWQEKLPIVVLRAEEILYSKANSETEYMELGTLWERANDAINTIIRRDDDAAAASDSSSVHLLHPCIEAALNLGCIPRRASRSQRHNNPSCYLSGISLPSHEPHETTHPIKAGAGGPSARSCSQDSDGSQLPPWTNLESPTSYNHKHPPPLPRLSQDCPFMPSSGRTYPLYYGPLHWTLQYVTEQDPQCGKPVADTLPDLSVNHPCVDRDGPSLNMSKVMGFDLALRLGPLSNIDLNAPNHWACDAEVSGSNKFHDLPMNQMGRRPINFEYKGFRSSPMNIADGLVESWMGTWGAGGEGLYFESPAKKARVLAGYPVEDGGLPWMQRVPVTSFYGRAEQPN
ncbi:hypothetical protein QJS10_CPA10g00380 [Acorus calamus]|uniref:Uncharacterized protein n=1 Tax=Acorus calamus TaxID=4465 RepID=A0AAV9DZ00_ACOCL|nr:hypothetical protein QJS10_CPA10g00380 [Acorus calamus]